MAIPKRKPSAIAFAAHLETMHPFLSNLTLNGLVGDSLTTELAERIRLMDHPDLGAVCQMLSVITSVPLPYSICSTKPNASPSNRPVNTRRESEDLLRPAM